jgi:hypothetical protein
MMDGWTDGYDFILHSTEHNVHAYMVFTSVNGS